MNKFRSWASFGTTASLKSTVRCSTSCSTISGAGGSQFPLTAYCIAFVAICSMLFSNSERLHLQREIFTVICTVRCKSLALNQPTASRPSLGSRVLI